MVNEEIRQTIQTRFVDLEDRDQDLPGIPDSGDWAARRLRIATSRRRSIEDEGALRSDVATTGAAELLSRLKRLMILQKKSLRKNLKEPPDEFGFLKLLNSSKQLEIP